MQNSVSVIIPTYNRSGLISRTIRSALAATSPGDEILVIDDGSTDDTEAVVRTFGDALRYVRIENSGPSAARNLGICLAKCPLVAFLDSDDEWLPDKLELQRKVMDSFPDVVFCFSNLLGKRPNGEISHDVLSGWRIHPDVGFADSPSHLREILGPGVPFSSIADLPKERPDFSVHVGDMYAALMEVLYVSNIAVLVRKELAGTLLLFPEDVRLMEDWYVFARLSNIGPAAYLDCDLAVQNVHEGPRLTNADGIRQATARIAVLERIWGTDDRFLSTHAARYQSVLKSTYLRRARLLIGKGQLEDAREDLKPFGGPLTYRLMASLPSVLAKSILAVKRMAGVRLK